MGDPSVWYRCYNFAELLLERGIQCDLAHEGQITEIMPCIENYTSVIFFRPRQSAELLQLITKLRDAQITHYASYDDLIFDVSTYHVSSTLKSWARKGLILARYKDWANAFDVFDNFITSSHYLTKKILALKPHAKIVKIDNTLPTTITQTLARLRKTKQRDRKRIGYFAGGASHQEDFNMIGGALAEVCQQENAQVLVPSLLVSSAPTTLIPYLAPFERLEYLPMLKLCCSVNVCIAPVVSDENSRGKSAIKYTEAIICGNPLVASELPSLEEYSEKTSLIVATDWLNDIKNAFSIQPTEEEIADTLSELDRSFTHAIEELRSNE